MSLVGTPSDALLAKITSDEVSGSHLGTWQYYLFCQREMQVFESIHLKVLFLYKSQVL